MTGGAPAEVALRTRAIRRWVCAAIILVPSVVGGYSIESVKYFDSYPSQCTTSHPPGDVALGAFVGALVGLVLIAIIAAVAKRRR